MMAMFLMSNGPEPTEPIVECGRAGQWAELKKPRCLGGRGERLIAARLMQLDKYEEWMCMQEEMPVAGREKARFVY